MVIWLVACSSTPEVPEPEPAPVEELAAVTWHVERDPVGLWTAEVPAEMKRGEKERTFQIGDGEPQRFVWNESSGRSFGSLKSEAAVGWHVRTRDLNAVPDALALMTHTPQTAEPVKVGDFDGQRWENSGALGHYTSVAFASKERLYFVRFSDSEKDRAAEAHDRFFSSFRVLAAAELTPEEASAALTFATERAAEAEQDAQPPPTPAEVASQRETLRALVQEKTRFMSCVLGPGESGAATLKISVRRGKVSSVRVYEVQTSFGNNPIPPKQRDDMLSACIASASKGWSFPEDLSASNVEIPLSFF